MPFTLWSRGILIGATDFALGDDFGPLLAGIFHPTEAGMMILPALTAMAPALFDLGSRMRDERLPYEAGSPASDRIVEFFEGSAEGQRFIAGAREVVHLELRAPSGHVLPFETILLSDLEELQTAGVLRKRKKHKKSKKRRKHRGDPVRYVISATLACPADSMLA
jgi:hypothetical protein